MTNREKRLRKRKRDYKWSQIGMIGWGKCPICDGTNTIQIYRYDAWHAEIAMNGLKKNVVTLHVRIVRIDLRLHTKHIGEMIYQ